MSDEFIKREDDDDEDFDDNIEGFENSKPERSSSDSDSRDRFRERRFEERRSEIRGPESNSGFERSFDHRPSGSGSSDGTIQIKKEDLWKYSTFILLAIVIIGGYYVYNGGGFTGKAVANVQPTPTQPAQPTQPTEAAVVPVTADDDAVLGDSDAPVTIIEFSEYECPFCKRYFDQTYPAIKKEYIDTGKVKIIFRDFPLSFHQQAQKAAEAAECAGEQGKYYEMHDKLFESGVVGGVDTFKNYAQGMGLDQGKFNTCLDSGAMAGEVQKDFQDGQKFGVKGTPAFFINGKLISGAQPFAAFQQAIDAEL